MTIKTFYVTVILSLTVSSLEEGLKTQHRITIKGLAL